MELSKCVFQCYFNFNVEYFPKRIGAQKRGWKIFRIGAQKEAWCPERGNKK